MITLNHSGPMSGNTAQSVPLRILPPTLTDCTDSVNPKLYSGIVGRKEFLFGSSIVLPSEVVFFNPDTTIQLETFRNYCRTAKELEYFHSAGCWIYQSAGSLSLLRRETNFDKKSRLLGLIEECLSGGTEVLSMRTAHFQTVLSKGESQANQITDLVETRVEVKSHKVP